MTTAKKILAVDDEEDILEILAFNLKAEGFEVDTVTSSEEALKKSFQSYDLFILDVMMGKMSGFRLAEKIRKEFKLNTPVIFLTARDTENDKITGFSLGADDYISKPFSVRELIARVNAILRRSSPAASRSLITVGEFIIDDDSKKIIANDIPIDLTKKEYELIALFLQNPGKIFSRSDLLLRVWGDDVVVTDRTVDVTIARARKKLGEKGNMIRNKSGYGYYFGN